jgi:hypothetical protein
MHQPYKDTRPSPAASAHSLDVLNDDDLPPSYAEAAGDVPTRRIDSADYTISGERHAYSIFPSVWKTKTVTVDATLSQSSTNLYRVISRQMKLPPRPQLVVYGSHTETKHNHANNRKESDKVVDFHFRLDLAETLLKGWEEDQSESPWHVVRVISDDDGQKAYRGGIFRSRTWKRTNVRRAGEQEIGNYAEEEGLIEPEQEEQDRNAGSSPDEAHLRTWCERFCNDPAPVKSYVHSSHHSRQVHLINFLASPSRAHSMASTKRSCALLSPRTSASSTTGATSASRPSSSADR